MANEEGRKDETENEHLYKTKVIQFFGRTVPIILQNDNGPCPLLAICNLLLLRNNMNLSLDISEVSQQNLLTLVAERLIDSNSNTENKDPGYVKNQQQNISDGFDLLTRLATGIDVNIQFRKIDDFEFTRECAIFDLLDIPLYHGWIVDPQDSQTANAIGSKSYNTLMGELVALETRNTEGIHNSNSVEDCIDFAAATTATLGVPSPCLSRGRSFDDSPCSGSGHQIARKGDIEEEAELLRALKLSTTEPPTSFNESWSAEANGNDLSVGSDESTHLKSSEMGVLEGHPGQHNFDQPEESTVDSNASSSCNSGRQSLETSARENDHSFSMVSSGSHLDQMSCKVSVEHIVTNDLKEHLGNAAGVQVQSEPLPIHEAESPTAYKDHKDGHGRDQQVQEMCPEASTSSIHLEQEDNQIGCDKTEFSGTSTTHADSDMSGGMKQQIDIPKSDTSSLDSSEPIYEGEDRILDSGLTSYENREPMYEGEVILAEQAERGTGEVHPKCDISQQNGELISNFLRNNASQLTVYGLFCLQEGLKERELCVFFRNNHFSTMYKLNGELYLLATDQGYLNQPDLVWEKLNEVNGDTVFMTGTFTEFKVDNHTNGTWDEHNAMANTADYLASIDNSTPASSTLNSDMQLAIALQQQEFDNQPQRHQNSQQSSSGGNSRLVTGPQVSRTSVNHPPSKQDAKQKDKCTVM